jgi:hypothetical protein
VKMSKDLPTAEEIPSAPVVEGKFVVIRRHFHDKSYFADENEELRRFYIMQGMRDTLTKANALIEERMQSMGGKHEDYKIFRLPIPEDW